MLSDTEVRALAVELTSHKHLVKHSVREDLTECEYCISFYSSMLNNIRHLVSTV